jgi:glyceraldehyde 3-phosphate dehydrogenase
MNNIILTTTGAAKALRLVIPEMRQIGFIAESVRIPTATGSLIILVVDLQEEPNREPIRRETINAVYRRTAELDPNGYLHYSEKQNVSGDIIGAPRAAAIIEGYETHTRTGGGRHRSGKCSGAEPKGHRAAEQHPDPGPGHTGGHLRLV